MRIIIDGMGGDNAPGAIVEGVVMASEKIREELVIIGREDEIAAELSKYEYDGSKVKILNATEVIENEEAPVRAVRTKKDSSIVKGLTLVKNGDADMFISAGSTGALMAGGLFIVGRIPGIDRPAVASMYPVLGKGVTLLVDSGANSECKPRNLLEFGVMGSIYMDKVMGIDDPRVGLVNLGAEENKGSTLTKAAFGLLQQSSVNFVGNVEARDVPLGACDVTVCDGFVGNVILKLSEGLGLGIMGLMKEKLTSNIKAKMGTLILKDKLKDLKSAFDYTEYGGAPILGIKGPVVKMHGSADANAVMNSIIKAVPYAKEGVVNIIQRQVLELEEIEESE